MESSSDQSQLNPSSPAPDPAALSSASAGTDIGAAAPTPTPTPLPDISPAPAADVVDAIEHVDHDDIDEDDISVVTTDPDGAAMQLIAHIGAPAARTFLEALTRQLGPSATTTEGRDAALQAVADEHAAPPTMVLVETIGEGFDGTKFRGIGEQFVIDARKIGKWMKRVETGVVEKVEQVL